MQTCICFAVVFTFVRRHYWKHFPGYFSSPDMTVHGAKTKTSMSYVHPYLKKWGIYFEVCLYSVSFCFIVGAAVKRYVPELHQLTVFIQRIKIQWKKTHVRPTNASLYNFCLQFVYLAVTCFGAIISPNSGSWHQNFFETYDNKTDHNKHTLQRWQQCGILRCSYHTGCLQN